MPRYLVVNADDFGLSDGVNRGVIEAFERGIVTSASLMVRQPAAEAAANYVRQNVRLSLGLHLDLGEWFLKDGEWLPLYSVVSTDDAKAVAAEVERQLTQFRKLAGTSPTHLDSHQHVHRNEPVRSIMLDWGRRLGVPLREAGDEVRYCGDFYGQDGEGQTLNDVLSIGGLKRVLESLSCGVTELGCHPGYDDGLKTAYRVERAREVEVLCAPDIPALLRGMDIQLRSFKDLPRGRPSPKNVTLST